jgi:hypothetical protein
MTRDRTDRNESNQIQSDSLSSHSTTIKDILKAHQTDLRTALLSGTLPQAIGQRIQGCSISTKNMSALISDAECRRVLGETLGIEILVEKSPSISELTGLLSQKEDGDGVRLVQALNLFFLNPETYVVGGMLIEQTFYSAFNSHPPADGLKELVCALRRNLSLVAFQGWQRLAGDCLLWSDEFGRDAACPGVYMEATQLRDGCFGTLRKPEEIARAVEVVREFMPKSLESFGSMWNREPNRFIPLAVWRGFPSEAQPDIMHRVQMVKDVVPWFNAILFDIRESLRCINGLCLAYDLDKSDTTQSLGQEDLDARRAEIAKRFELVPERLSGVTRVFAEMFHQAKEITTKAKRDTLHGAVCNQIGGHIAQLVDRVCECLKDADGILTCSSKLVAALDELLHGDLELPLDLPLEVRRDDGTMPSTYTDSLLGCFVDALERGNLISAINLRLLFPSESTSDLPRLETVDLYVRKNQRLATAGVIKAVTNLLQGPQLGPSDEDEIMAIHSALEHLVDIPRMQGGSELIQVLGAAVRALTRREARQQDGGVRSSWGALHAGRIIKRLQVNRVAHTELIEVVFRGEDTELPRAVAACIAAYNQDPKAGSGKAYIDALYRACRDYYPGMQAPRAYYAFLEPFTPFGRTVMENMQEQLYKALDMFFGDPPEHPSPDSRWEGRASVLARKLSNISEEQQQDRLVILSKLAHDWTGSYSEIEGPLTQVGASLLITSHMHSIAAMLRNSDSRDFDSREFRAAFAQCLVACVWGEKVLSDKDRILAAKSLADVLESGEVHLVCNDTFAAGQLVSSLRSMSSDAYSSTDKRVRTIAESRALSGFLVCWGVQLKHSGEKKSRNTQGK